MNEQHEALVRAADAAIAVAIAKNDALREYERRTVGVPSLAFTPAPSMAQLTRWRTHVDAVRGGTRTSSLV
jgi:hypothetical protein